MLKQDMVQDYRKLSSREAIDVMCKVLGFNAVEGTANGSNLTLLGGKGYFVFANEQGKESHVIYNEPPEEVVYDLTHSLQLELFPDDPNDEDRVVSNPFYGCASLEEVLVVADLLECKAKTRGGESNDSQ